tara:strand:- start:124 stop:459 length:336 start_codon:yes stop_codon:yes gene_type:complete
MRRLKIVLSSFVFFALSIQPVLAQCYSNGKEVSCGDIWWVFLIPLLMLPIGLAVFVFWLIMLVDAIKYQEEEKLMWVLLIVFLGIIGALVYYFVEKRKRKKTLRDRIIKKK